MSNRYYNYGKTIFLIIIIYYGIVNYQNLQGNTIKANEKYNSYYNLISSQLKKHNIILPNFFAPKIVATQMKTFVMILAISEIIVSFLIFSGAQWKLILLCMISIIWIQGLYFIDPLASQTQGILLNVEYGCLLAMLLGLCFMTWGQQQQETPNKNAVQQKKEQQKQDQQNNLKKSKQKRM